MPRPKVSEQARRRIAKACIHCQAGKQKCDGLRPCDQCTKRNRPSDCQYSSHVRSYGLQRRRRQVNPTTRVSSTLHPQHHDDYEDDPRDDSRGIHVAVPRLPHGMRDPKGKNVYFGNSAALSFLQNIQELMLVEDTIPGVSVDTSHQLAPENLESYEDGESSLYDCIDESGLQSLIDVFFASTCGIMDIFDRSYTQDLMGSWINRSLSDSGCSTSILYLVIAYALQARCTSDADAKIARSCFRRGQRSAVLRLTSDPSIESIRAFLLISLYMLGESQRDAAHFNLGIALSAARALGYHRIHAEVGQENQWPRRIWRTLCYHDLFFCAMMGRTPSTSTTDLLEEDGPPPDSKDPSFSQHLGMIESSRAFSIMRQTVIKIYTKHTVPLGLLRKISSELQELRQNMPSELLSFKTPDALQKAPHQNRQYILRNASVVCDYHFSMMLLTRPFLVACLRMSHQDRDTTAGPRENAIHDEVAQGADQAIDAATSTIQIIHDIHIAGLLYNNMPLIVARVFVSALTVCAAFFGGLGDSKACELAIHQADRILQHFMKCSPQAKQYNFILKKLSQSAFPGATTDCNSDPGDAESHLGGSSGIPPDRMMDGSLGVEELDNYYDLSVDLQFTESIWDINWDGMLL